MRPDSTPSDSFHVELVCEGCGEPFSCPRRYVKRRPVRFCSRTCRITFDRNKAAAERTARLAESSVPYGYCHCGCGQKTHIQHKTNYRYGTVAGEPAYFLRGHSSRRQAPEVEHVPEGVRIPLESGVMPGLSALIDPEDLELVSQYRWHPEQRRNGIYAVAMVQKDGRSTNIQMHRLLLDAPPHLLVDHINHDTLDNRRSCNLRLATHAQNAWNALPRKRTGASSRFKGVSFRKDCGRWQAVIQYHTKRVRLGLFDIEEDAARAYDRAAIELYGEFALTNLALGLLAGEAQ